MRSAIHSIAVTPGLDTSLGVFREGTAVGLGTSHTTPSNAHRHDDAPVPVLARICRPQFRCAFGILQDDLDVPVLDDAKKVKQESRIKAYPQWLVVVRRIQRLRGLTGITARSGKSEASRLQSEANRV